LKKLTPEQIQENERILRERIAARSKSPRPEAEVRAELDASLKEHNRHFALEIFKLNVSFWGKVVLVVAVPVGLISLIVWNCVR